jgi:hypothetical protein
LDFSAFVATSRGISCDEAEQLIENWLKDYRPRTRGAIRVLGVRETSDPSMCAQSLG